MFCDYCGREIDVEYEAFCSKCGNRTRADIPLICEKCGSNVGSDSKFCNKCGEPTLQASTKKAYCQYCGTKYTDGDAYCKKCGHAVSQGLFSIGENRGTKSAGSTVKSFFSGSNMRLLHMILAGLLTLFLIFSFIPSFKSGFDVWGNEMSFTSSMALPFNMFQQISKMTNDEGAIGGVILFFGALIEVLVLGSGIAVTVMPILKNTLEKKRRYIWQFIICGGRFIGFFTTLILLNAVMKENSYNLASVKVTFGGVMYLIIDIAIIALTSYLAYLNYKMRQKG